MTPCGQNKFYVYKNKNKKIKTQRLHLTIIQYPQKTVIPKLKAVTCSVYLTVQIQQYKFT